MDTNQPRSNPENGMKPLAIPVPEMARLLGISPKKAYQLVKQPNFPATKLEALATVISHLACKHDLQMLDYIEQLLST